MAVKRHGFGQVHFCGSFCEKYAIRNLIRFSHLNWIRIRGACHKKRCFDPDCYLAYLSASSESPRA